MPFNLFGGRRQTRIGHMQVLFHLDAAVHGSHGQIRVSHRKHGLRERAVNFVFVGFSTAPELTPSLIEHVWKEAYAQGYVPHGLIGCLDDNVLFEEARTEARKPLTFPPGPPAVPPPGQVDPLAHLPLPQTPSQKAFHARLSPHALAATKSESSNG